MLFAFAFATVCTAGTVRGSQNALSEAPKTVITILIDDLGSYDTAVNNEDIAYVTPNLHNLSHAEGLRLSRFYTYKYCSPTRRSFLSGRFPVHMSALQAQPCDNLLPMELTILPQKLKQAAVPWATHFVGKGHLGYPTTDHLPINRGFDSHVGYLCGAEDYDYGYNENRDPTHDCGGTPKSCTFDFWHDGTPATSLHEQVFYSTNFYTKRAQEILVAHANNASTSNQPLWVHLMYQGVHLPYVPPPAWERLPNGTGFWDQTFGDMLHVVDAGIGNLTATLKEQGMWNSTLLIITSDNGGIGPGNNYPFRGHKAQVFEGGTRVMGFLTGGFLPPALRGSTFPRVMGVQDWYPTLCGFAGVDATDDVVLHNATRPIDGKDVWPAIMSFGAAQQGRAQGQRRGQHEGGEKRDVVYLHEYLPTTEHSLIWQERWKYVDMAQSTNWYTPNNTHVHENRTKWPCKTPSPPPTPAGGGCNATMEGYDCHTAMYCGPKNSFYFETGNVTDASSCATLCTANTTGCNCFDYRNIMVGKHDKAACRLHANKGTALSKSGAGYSAYVRKAPPALVAARLRAAADATREERLARQLSGQARARSEAARLRYLQARDSQPSCNVCTPDEPCLFDLLADPEEQHNVATANPDIVMHLAAKLATYQAYIGHPMTHAQYEPYECVKDIRPWWGNFSGPCCKPKAGTTD